VTAPPARIIRTPDGVDIAVRDFGGGGQPILFAHATGFCGALFEPLIAHLRSDFHCVALDLRGHGDSAPPPDLDFDWRGFATDLLAVVDTLDLEAPSTVGHSCGAAAAFLAEQRRPGTFARMYGYEPAMAFREGIDVPGPNPLSEGARRRRSTFASRAELVTYLHSKALFARLDPAVLDAYVEHGFATMADGSLQLKCLPEYEARTFENGGSNDAVERLGEVDCPVTLVYGDAPDSFPPAMAEAVSSRLRHVELRTAVGLGHLGPLEAPATIAADIVHAFG
jgi:pimeloyl-ACP methyl ester carboxylesterase